MTLEQLVKHVQSKLNESDDGSSAQLLNLETIVRATIDGLGFHISNSGEVCDPRPQPVNVFTPPRQQNVRWRGGKKLR